MARILLVDDESDLRITIGHMLRSLGHAVIEAAGRADLDVLEGQRFDILLTDIVMPDSSGLDVIALIRNRQPNIKIIAMSGDAFVSGVGPLEKILEFGADSFIRKPFKKKQLRTVIDACLKNDRQSER